MLLNLQLEVRRKLIISFIENDEREREREEIAIKDP
jgi:hypothetical protein